MKNKIVLTVLGIILSTTVYSQNIAGSWIGKVNYGTNSINIVFNISENETGEYTCTTDIPDHSIKGITTTILFISSDSISVRLPYYDISYNGKLHEDIIRGIYSQAGFETEVFLNHFMPNYQRPQNPKPPYPYYTEEVLIANNEAGVSLSGTLTFPIGYQKGEKVPVVLLITGSGPQNRDNELYEHKPFLIIADYFARNGYATLRYDDRSVGKSTGRYQAETTIEVAEDAEQALSFLRNSKQFSTIGALGHSEGANVVFMLGAKRLIDFAISMAGMGIKGDDCLYEQAVIIAAQSNQKYQLSKEQLRDYLKSTQVPWYDFFLDYDPTSDISKTLCPVFVINGEKDMQVIAKSNVKAITNTLPKNKKSRFKIYPGLNHLLQECDTGLPAEYINIEQTISPVVLDDMIEWLNHL